jgi:hypothetical protein
MTKKDLTAIAWGRPKWVGEYRTWLGNRGEYKVTYNTTYQGIKVPGPHYMAFVRRDGTKDQYDFVQMHKRYRTLNAGQTACLEHARKQCRSMNTNAPVATKPKNSKRNLEVLATALRAGRSKDSSEASAKSGSHNLEALLSRNTRGASVKAEGSRALAVIRQPNGRMLRQQLLMLYGVLDGTMHGIEHGLQQLGMDSRDFDVNEIEDQLLDLNLERCAGCGWWVESGELVPSDDDEKSDLTGCCQDCRDYL